MTITAAKLKVEVEADTGPAERQLKQFGGSMGSILGNAASTAAGTMAGMLSSQLVMGLGRTLADVGRVALTAYADFERLNLSLASMVAREMVAGKEVASLGAAMNGAKERAKDLQAWIQRLAVQSPFDSTQVAASLRLGLSYGFTIAQAQRLTQATLDFASGSGSTAEGMGRIALALGQIQARGKVASQELNQLSEAGINARKYMADAFGVTTAELMKMVEQGLVPAGKAVEAIVAGMERDFAGAGKAQANTFSGLLSSLEELKQINLREFFAGTFQAIQPFLVQLVNALQDPALTGAIKKLGADIGVYVGKALNDLSAAFARFTASVNAGTPAIVAFANAFGFQALVVGLNDIIRTINQVMEAVEALVNGFDTAARRIVGAINNMQRAVHDWRISLAQASQDLGHLLDQAAGRLTGGLSAVPAWGGGTAYGGWGGGGGRGGFGGAGDTSGFQLDRIPLLPTGQMQGPAQQTFTDTLVGTAWEVGKAWGSAGDTATKAAFDTGEALAATTKGFADDLAAKLKGIPGLFSTSSVTAGDMARAKAGLPVNYPDDYVRQVADEFFNNVDYSNISVSDVAGRLGMDASLPLQVLYDALVEQWNSGEFFADPKNLEVINWDAAREAMQKSINASIGEANLLAAALKQGLTPEAFAKLGVGESIGAATLASVQTPAAVAVFNNAGASSASAWASGFDGWITDNWHPPGPNGAAAGPDASIPLTGGNGQTFNLTLPPRAGSTPVNVPPASGLGVNVNVNVTGNPSYQRTANAVTAGVVNALRARGR